MSQRIVALFENRDQADTAVQALQAADFSDDILRVFLRDDAVTMDDKSRDEVTLTVMPNDDKRDIAQNILRKSGAIEVSQHRDPWSSDGWVQANPLISARLPTL